VEESFNLQAAHDFLIHRTNLSLYDHRDFAGGGGGQIVSRSFLGALFLSLASLPAYFFVWALGLPKPFLQVGVRLTLAWGVCSALRAFARAVARRSGWAAGVGTLLCAAACPHYMFYASRTLPNTFATILVAHGAAWWARLPPALPEGPGGGDGGCGRAPAAAARRALCGWARPREPLFLAVCALSLALVWFRCDMLVLLGPVAGAWLLAGRATLPQLAFLGAGLGGAGVLVSLAFDSVLWGRLLWPEAEVLWKNVVGGVMHNYEDTKQVWHYYFSKALPMALLGALPLVPLGLVTWARAPRSAGAFLASLRVDAAVAELAIPALAFVALYSMPANKQDRFILPAYPLLFYAAGAGGARVAVLAAWLLAGAGDSEADASAAAVDVGPFTASPLPSPRTLERASSKGAPSQRRARQGAGGGGGAPRGAAPTPAPPPARKPPPPPLLRRAAGGCLVLGLCCLTLGSVAGCVAFGWVSAHNYPGGVALQRLYTIVARDIERAAERGERAVASLPWRARRAGGGADAPLPPCPEGDVTGASGAREWWRQCLFGGACPTLWPWGLPSASPPLARGGARPCAPLGGGPDAGAPITVHVSNRAAITGVSRFGEGWRGGWLLNKTEKLMAGDYAAGGFDFLIAEKRDAGGDAYAFVGDKGEAVVDGEPYVEWGKLRSWPPKFSLKTTPQLYLLMRKGP
jgi:hypothetical protein